MNKANVKDYETYVGQLQTIHKLRDELELTPDAYRDLLYRLTGSRSAKFMTPAQRDKVISFMALHKDLDETVAKAEAARAQLNSSFTGDDEPPFQKDVFLDGQFQTRSAASLENLVTTMRAHHGDEVMLTGVREVRLGGATRLKLEFSTAAAPVISARAA